MQCPTCGREFASDRSLAVHRRTRVGNPCVTEPSWYARQLAKQAARARDGESGCPGCGDLFRTLASVETHRAATTCRKSEAEKRVNQLARQRRWYQRHYVPRAPRMPRPQRTKVVRTLEPVPSSPAGHPWYEEARTALNRAEANELGGDFDSIGQDLMQDYVLARVAGTDPTLALQRTRRRYNKDRKVLVYGMDRVDDLRR